MDTGRQGRTCTPRIAAVACGLLFVCLAGCHGVVPGGGAPPDEAPHIVGAYYRGDGLAFNQWLDLHPDGTFRHGASS